MIGIAPGGRRRDPCDREIGINRERGGAVRFVGVIGLSCAAGVV